jgi:hypothetical protein
MRFIHKIRECDYLIFHVKVCSQFKYTLRFGRIIYDEKLPMIFTKKKLDESAVSALRSAIAEVKQRWSVIRWMTKNLLSSAPPCFGSHVKPLVPAEFAPTNTHWVRVVG